MQVEGKNLWIEGAVPRAADLEICCKFDELKVALALLLNILICLVAIFAKAHLEHLGNGLESHLSVEL